MQCNVPDNKIHGANVGPTLGRQYPGGPHVGDTNLTIWGVIYMTISAIYMLNTPICIDIFYVFNWLLKFVTYCGLMTPYGVIWIYENLLR